MTILEYYKYYLTLHEHPKSKLLHFIGQLATIVFSVWVLYNWYWYLIPMIQFIIYPVAWSGHYFFENNEPAAFHHPIKAKISVWIMFKDILLGRFKLW